MATILITGGTGLVGRALTSQLVSEGHEVIILTRNAAQRESTDRIRYAAWNVEEQEIDRDAVAAADYIVHLAGAGVAEKPWTDRRKREILDSRVKSGHLLVKALREIPNKVMALVSASAIGWYGPDPVIPNPRPFSEEDPAAPGFLGETCMLWENSIRPVAETSTRLVILRIGIVLSREGGALKEFARPLRFGVAPILGSGRQVISWIQVDDLVGLIRYSLHQSTWRGVYNAVAPQPVSNRKLILALARLRRRIFLPVWVPSFILRWKLGAMSEEILKSATVSSHKIQNDGFRFCYPDIQSALRHTCSVP